MSVTSVTSVTNATSIRQASTTPPGGTSRFGTIARHAAIGGAIGAVAAAGLSFVGPIPVIGGMFAPIAAAIGGAAGLVVGGLVGFLRSQGTSTAGARFGASTIQAAPPVPTTSQLPPPLPRR